MLDANDLLQAIKRAAKEANEAGQPSDFCFGTVINIAPLQILVEQKMTLGVAQLVLTRNVTDYAALVTVNMVTGTAEFESKDVTDHEHTHDVSGLKSIIIHNALQIGDEVILLKRKGGQQYLVLDRVVTA